MLFIICYCIFGGAAAFGLLYLIYRRKVKKDNLTKKSFLYVMPPIIGIINFILAGIFMLLYVLNPASFSPEQTITSPVAYVLFTIFSTYFYVLALPLSIGCVGISVMLYKKQYNGGKKFVISTITNSVGAVLLAILTYQAFG